MRRLFLVAACLCGASLAQAQVYKCVDARGVTQYSDKPRPECRSAEVDIQPIPPVSGKVAPYKEDLKAAERDFQRRQIQREREEAAEKKKIAEQQRRCAALRADLQRANAVRHPADSVAHDARLAKLNTDIAQACP